ncbi:hypothetical protein HLB44_35045 [Aquincola sp. S2]|uniref:Copper chaperone PCu(A)C n=1 Tax=Pseudaquabacterium terrae TaxID=2732868 RepID=A0ABX2EU13_9BURK|nr:hypothetical protein [Aquabacterium terrae]NRF72214.1 hypothetical protein [Aquabacterium terrae]
MRPAVGCALAPPDLEGNRAFQVRWSGPAGAGDRIVLVDPQGSSRAASLLSHAIATGTTAANLRAPAQSGEFDVLFRMAQGIALAGQRLTVAMEPIVLRVPGPAKAGKPFQVQFTGDHRAARG